MAYAWSAGGRRHAGRVAMWRRPEAVPPGWRVVDFAGPEKSGRSYPVPGTRQMELLRLVLEARGIPHMVTGHGTQARAFVPAMFELLARSELAAVAAEKPVVRPRVPLRRNAHWAMLPLLVLILLHGMRMGWWLSGTGLPSSAGWLECGRLDVDLVRAGEWWRTVTSLTLHSDGLHLFSNVLFAAPFFAMLAQRIGLGMALSASLLAGALGNACDVLYRDPGYASIGASTVMFGIVGLLCADIVVRSPERGLRRLALPVAAGMGFLAMLGAEGQNIDYAAHVFGLACGFGVGLPAGFCCLRGAPGVAAQLALGVLGAALPLVCWMRAFNML
ncbi:MAG: rhomboid family intramembrane serine protease [Mailhella sp.]|nr:rhomboid family intramembrane serine protease [Mailhella sp.]